MHSQNHIKHSEMYSTELLLESTTICILLDRLTVEVSSSSMEHLLTYFDKGRTYTPKWASAKLLDWSSQTSWLPQ